MAGRIAVRWYGSASHGCCSPHGPCRWLRRAGGRPAASTGEEPSRELGTVTVIGRRPTSLPTQIPTTIEGIDGEDIRVRINATDAEDALKYFPSLLVRKRYIGDYDHAVLASRASGTNNSARSLVYVDGILISNLLGNGAIVHAALGPRDSRGDRARRRALRAVLGRVSRQLRRRRRRLRDAHAGRARDARARVELRRGLPRLPLARDATRDWQASASVGNRQGPWSWWLNFNRLDSDAHPVSYANKLVEQRRARHGRHARHGRARRAESAQSGLADPGLDDGDAHDPGSCEAQGRLRDLAAPAR